MPNLTSALNLLQQERNRLSSQLESLSNAISALRGPSGTGKTMSAARPSANRRCPTRSLGEGQRSESRLHLPAVDVAGCHPWLWLTSEQRRNPAGRSGERRRRSAEGSHAG